MKLTEQQIVAAVENIHNICPIVSKETIRNDLLITNSEELTIGKILDGDLKVLLHSCIFLFSH